MHLNYFNNGNKNCISSTSTRSTGAMFSHTNTPLTVLGQRVVLSIQDHTNVTYIPLSHPSHPNQYPPKKDLPSVGGSTSQMKMLKVMPGDEVSTISKISTISLFLTYIRSLHTGPGCSKPG